MTKKITKRSRLVIAIICTVCLLIGSISTVVLYFSSSNARENQDSAKQKEMIAMVLEWGRLAPFPAKATSVSIQTEGSSFTRSFRASFVASKQDIQTWIEKSPGVKEATPEELSDTKTRYVIVPGGGANSTEITIDNILSKVEIYVSWG